MGTYNDRRLGMHAASYGRKELGTIVGILNGVVFVHVTAIVNLSNPFTALYRMQYGAVQLKNVKLTYVTRRTIATKI